MNLKVLQKDLQHLFFKEGFYNLLIEIEEDNELIKVSVYNPDYLDKKNGWVLEADKKGYINYPKLMDLKTDLTNFVTEIINEEKENSYISLSKEEHEKKYNVTHYENKKFR